MLSKEFVQSNGLNATEYLDSIQEKYKDKWTQKLQKVDFSIEQLDFLKQSYLPINIVAFSGEWCPDCQNGIPVVMKMAELSPFINIYIFDRDSHKDVIEKEKLTVNGGMRVPFVLFMNDKFDELGRWVERSSLAYNYLYESKMEAINAGIDDYSQFLREKYRTNTEKLFSANIEEIFSVMKKSVLLRSAGAKLNELQPEMVI